MIGPQSCTVKEKMILDPKNHADLPKQQSQIIKLALQGKGMLLGHEDVIGERDYSTTVVCKSHNAILYACVAEEFNYILNKDDTAREVVEKMCT